MRFCGEWFEIIMCKTLCVFFWNSLYFEGILLFHLELWLSENALLSRQRRHVTSEYGRDFVAWQSMTNNDADDADIVPWHDDDQNNTATITSKDKVQVIGYLPTKVSNLSNYQIWKHSGIAVLWSTRRITYTLLSWRMWNLFPQINMNIIRQQHLHHCSLKYPHHRAG